MPFVVQQQPSPLAQVLEKMPSMMEEIRARAETKKREKQALLKSIQEVAFLLPEDQRQKILSHPQTVQLTKEFMPQLISPEGKVMFPESYAPDIQRLTYAEMVQRALEGKPLDARTEVEEAQAELYKAQAEALRKPKELTEQDKLEIQKLQLQIKKAGMEVEQLEKKVDLTEKELVDLERAKIELERAKTELKNIKKGLPPTPRPTQKQEAKSFDDVVRDTLKVASYYTRTPFAMISEKEKLRLHNTLLDTLQMNLTIAGMSDYANLMKKLRQYPDRTSAVNDLTRQRKSKKWSDKDWNEAMKILDVVFPFKEGVKQK